YQRQQYRIEIFNRGQTPFPFTIQKSVPWIEVSTISGEIDVQKDIMVSIHWEKVPEGVSEAFITIQGPGKQKARVKVAVDHTFIPQKNKKHSAFVEHNGVIAIEAAHYHKAINGAGMHWVTIPGLGRTLS